MSQAMCHWHLAPCRARKENVKLASLIKQRYNVNVLSIARFFLFGR
jgi:hypothetical protein